MDQWTNGQMDRQTDKASHRVAFYNKKERKKVMEKYGGTSLDPIFMRKLGLKWKHFSLSTLDPTIFVESKVEMQLGLKWKC